MSYPGIDYSLGKSNFDPETGIHFGVISCHSLSDALYDAQEFDYGDATCPKCCNPVVDSGDDSIPATCDREDWDYSGNDFACLDCKSTFWSDQCYSDEPIGWSIDDGEYKVIDCLDSDAMVIKSPFYTMAQFCSPCVPGAGSLDNPCDDGAKSYCFGHDWFETGRAPYPVYSVETGAAVLPETVQS